MPSRLDPALVARIEPLARAGLSSYRIADMLGIGQTAVSRRVKALRDADATMPPAIRFGGRGARITPARRRPCLCCGKPFESQGAHNRLCAACRQGSASVFETPHSVRY